ncbi:MAG: hypothetical protein IM608_11825, partial [Phenylobacterium sp.]|nr:hypothetical protein [Phenylobacterium sp.]
MACDILLLSPWSEPVTVSPGYQLIRRELAECAGELTRSRLDTYLQRYASTAARVTDVA